MSGAMMTSIAVVAGSMVMGKLMAPDPATQQLPQVTQPGEVPIPPELDPKKKATAERDVLTAGMQGESPLSRSSTILGSNTLG